jgi:hypothetical protein
LDFGFWILDWGEKEKAGFNRRKLREPRVQISNLKPQKSHKVQGPKEFRAFKKKSTANIERPTSNVQHRSKDRATTGRRG